MGHITSGRRTLVVTLVTLLAAILGVVALLTGGPQVTLWWTRGPLVQGARVGMSRQEVIDHLGPPRHIAHSRAEFRRGDTSHYKPVPTAPVEKEVLEYYSFVWKLYVYIDHSDRVSRVVLART